MSCTDEDILRSINGQCWYGFCMPSSEIQPDKHELIYLTSVIFPSLLQSCWRNIYLDGMFLDCFAINPLTYDLPHRGVLCLDYVTYDVPSIPHADLFARTQTLRAEVFRIKRPALWIMSDETPPVLSSEGTEEVGAKGGKGMLDIQLRCAPEIIFLCCTRKYTQQL